MPLPKPKLKTQVPSQYLLFALPLSLISNELSLRGERGLRELLVFFLHKS